MKKYFKEIFIKSRWLFICFVLIVPFKTQRIQNRSPYLNLLEMISISISTTLSLSSYYYQQLSMQITICLTKMQTLIKTKRNRKLKIPHTVLERRTLCFISYKNRKIKSKTVISCNSRKEKEGIFCTTDFVRKNVF